MHKATVFLVRVKAHPLEFNEREREAFSNMHPELSEQARFNYVLRLCEKAGHCTVIALPPPVQRVHRKRAFVTIL